jgi:hypothetical protein
MTVAPRPLPVAALWSGPGVAAGLLVLIGFAGAVRGLRDSDFRYTVFGTSTALLGIAVLNMVLATMFPSNAYTLSSRVTALVGACGYLLLADPPRWLPISTAGQKSTR